MTRELGFQFGLLGILFFLAACFASTETALFSLTRIERRRLLDRHPRMGRLVESLLERPRRALATLLIGNNIVHIAAAALATLMALDFFGPQGVSLAVAVFTVILVFIGELLPKVLAVRSNERLAMVSAPFLMVVAGVIFPVRRVVEWVSDWVLGRLTRGEVEVSQRISAQELKVLVKVGEEEGILDRRERWMIQKLFELGERPVRSIMTPRTDVVALRHGDPWDKQLETMRHFHFSHFPVYQETIDQITGVVSTQSAILGGERDLSKLVKPVKYVPESKRIDELLREFQKTGDRFAVCVDEFGGTAGVVTLEDILEEIFGEFYDEYAKPDEPIRELGAREYLVDARIPLSEFNRAFHLGLRSEAAETLSGFLLEKMGKVPRKGDSFELPEITFKIQDMARQRILKVSVVLKRGRGRRS